MESKMNDLCRESRKAGLMINYAKTEKITVNNTTIALENRERKQVIDFCYVGSTVSENGGAILDVGRRIQKTPKAFPKLQKVWQSTLMKRERKIKTF
jgi:hypothetical protein